MRRIEKEYQDPVEIIWVHAARQLGIEVRRDPEVFAAWDGNGVLRVGTAETLDADDSLAQMIFHELCHWLVEGPESFSEPDWGLVYDEPTHEVHEHACLRLQSAKADQFGLRQFFASTTDYRAYFDSLPSDPLEPSGDPAVELAQAGWERAGEGVVAATLDLALQKTREIANVVRPLVPTTSIWGT